jgi:predicted dehydrogenase
MPVVPKTRELGRVAGHRLSLAPTIPMYLPWKWRGWWDFGTGAFGDVACHIMDGAYWALNLGAPTAVEAMSTQAPATSPRPLAAVVTNHFPARGSSCRR